MAGAVADPPDLARGELEPGCDSAAVAGGVWPGGAGCEYWRRDSSSRDSFRPGDGDSGSASGAQAGFVRVGASLRMAVARDAAFHRAVVVDRSRLAARSAHAGRD